MGTVKKLVLASLVSSIMVLTFAIGLFPTPASLDVSAQSGGGIDLLDFFSKALGLDKQVSLSSVLITYPEDNSVIKVLSNSTAANIPVRAEIAPLDAAALVTFGIDGNTPTPGTWNGTVTSNMVSQSPYVAHINLFDLGANIFGAHEMYGLAQAAKATVSYDVLDVIDFTVQELDAAVVDINGDGILDNPFTNLAPGEIYVGTLGGKHIVIADLDILGSGSKIEGELGSVIVPVVTDGLTFTVQTGSLTEFLAETIDGNRVIPLAERAVLLVEVAPTLEELVGPTEAANAPASPNGAALAFGAQYVEISIIYTTDFGMGNFFTEVQELPDALPVRLVIDGLAAAPGEPSGAAVWGLSTDIDDGTVVTIPAGREWGKRADSTLDLFNASLEIYLTELSIFATLESAMSIASVDPSAGLTTGGETVALTGTFPGAGNLTTVAQAAAAYTVYFGNTIANFVLPAKGAIPVVSATNMYVSVPANNVAANTSVDIWLYDNVSPSDFTSLAAAYTYAVTPSVTGITPSVGPLSGGDVVTITGTNLSTATLVSFGANMVVPTSVTDTAITVTTPAGAAVGTVLVSVQTGGGVSTEALQYTYQAQPTITGFTPDTGLTTGGEQVTITGTNLTTVLSVSIAGTPANFTEGSKGTPGTTLVVTTGVAAAAGVGPVVVITAGGIVSSAPAEFTYEEPIIGVPDVTVTGIEPSTGWMFGGAIAVVSGSGFLDGDGVPTVTFGGTAANILEATNTELYVQIPATGASISLAGDGASVVDVTVERVDLKSIATLTDAFTYHSYVTNGNTTTTATVLTSGVGTIGIKVAGGTDASLFIPSATGVTDVKVLAMAFNTGSLSAFNTGTIPAPVNGLVAPGTLTFSTHLYTDNPVFNTGTAFINTGSLPSLVAGQSTLIEVTANATYPSDNPAMLSAPVSAIKLTAADIATGQVAAITRKSSGGAPPTALDYATPSATASLDIGSGEAFSSQLLTANFPDQATGLVNVGYTGLGTMQVFTETDLTAFFNFDEIVLTLQVIRKGTTVPVDIVGPLVPGDTIVVTSAEGGLGFVSAANVAENGAGTTKGAAPAGFDLEVVPGAEDAFTVRLTIPANATGVNGTVDLNIFLPSDVGGVPTFTLETAFVVETDVVPPIDFLPLILAALAALLLGGGDGGGGGPCFIATAAYGTPMAAEIETLRALRDTYLLDNAIGTALVDTYYRVSPAIADVVAQSPVMAAVVRLLLLPVVMLSKIALASPALTALFAFMGGSLLIGRRRTRNNKA